MNCKHLPTALVACASLLATAAFVHVEPAASDERAEIKLLVQRDKVPEAMAALKLTEPANKHYQIYFVDTADFKLSQAGLILRLRDKGKGKTESTVKFRPEDPSKPIDQEWLPKLAREPEWLVGKGQNLSYSLEQEITGTELLRKPADDLDALFSAEQKEFFKLVMKEELDPAKLKVFGPIAAQIWEWEEPAVGDKVSAELWNLGDTQIFELSRKTKPDGLKKKAQDFEKAFQNKGVAVDPDPTSKTRKALEYYSKPS
jgi:CYTH domain